MPDEGLTNKAASTHLVDFAFGPYALGRPAARVMRWICPAIMPPATMIDGSGRYQTEGLMRTFLIVNPQPVLKRALLSTWVCRRRIPVDEVKIVSARSGAVPDIVSGIVG